MCIDNIEFNMILLDYKLVVSLSIEIYLLGGVW